VLATDGPLWLVRHAPTRDNEAGVLMGSRDPGATAAGLAAAAGLLRDVAFASAFSSDARRAQDTARAIAPGVPLHVDGRLRERSFGAWEGRPRAALQAAQPDAFTAAGAVRLDADPPGGESLSALLARVHAALTDVLAAGGPALLVAHNGSLRAALVLLGVHDLAAAASLSLAHLEPLRVQRPRLRDPQSIERPVGRSSASSSSCE
jgi:broad specificity phosphatase PhoE